MSAAMDRWARARRMMDEAVRAAALRERNDAAEALDDAPGPGSPTRPNEDDLLMASVP